MSAIRDALYSPKRVLVNLPTAKLEKNIPIPGPCACYGLYGMLELHKMDVGDCRTVDKKTYNNNSSLRARVCQLGKKLNMKFKTRQYPDSIRIWRIS